MRENVRFSRGQRSMHVNTA